MVTFGAYKIYMTKFNELGLNPLLIDALKDLGFKEPSGIQQKTIPVLLEKETDLIGLAQTGTGKTAAFGLPLLQKINPDSPRTQGIVLSPTRELCKQITDELLKYAQNMPKVNIVAVYGGASINDQKRQLNRGAQLIVATPGRMKDMLDRRMIDISEINYCVLDEADEMLNMGFYEDITDILKYTSREKHTWLFSATMPKEVSKIAAEFMRDPVEITVGAKNESTKTVSHEYYLVPASRRYEALKRLIDAEPEVYAVIFCRTKRDTQKVAERLAEEGYNAAALHGDLSQNQRDLVMAGFRKKHVHLLVATDVAARGIDVDDLTHVIHYRLPDEIEVYTHRSGRTGRAGKTGVSMVICTRGERNKLSQIERIINQNFLEKKLPEPENIIKAQLISSAQKIKNTEVDSGLDEYFSLIEEELGSLDKTELLKKVFSLEFTRLNSYYKNAENLEDTGRHSSANRKGNRYFISMGRKDGLTAADIRSLIIEQTGLQPELISEVDLKGSFSFFNSEFKDKDKILRAFTDFIYQGRKVGIEVADDKPRRKKSRRDNRNFKNRNSRSSRRGPGNKAGRGRQASIKNSIKRRRKKNNK